MKAVGPTSCRSSQSCRTSGFKLLGASQDFGCLELWILAGLLLTCSSKGFPVGLQRAEELLVNIPKKRLFHRVRKGLCPAVASASQRAQTTSLLSNVLCTAASWMACELLNRAANEVFVGQLWTIVERESAYGPLQSAETCTLSFSNWTYQ